jgi:serralysin
MDKLKVCVDLSGKSDESLFSLYNAYNERSENVLNESHKSVLKVDTITEQTLIDAKRNRDFERLLIASSDCKNKLLELALWKSRMWANGKTLKVKFLEGDNYLQSKVIHYAKKWEDFANIKFDFITTGNAEIRISFMMGKGSWSYVGTDALSIRDQNKPTMNYGWFDSETPDIEFSRTVIHEFGHCLGCIHEHQSPSARINWNKPVVYDYYWRTQGWTKEDVDNNLFAKFDQSEVTNSDFDKKSIMLYPIPKEFTSDGFSVGWNSILSTLDLDFIRRCYPK